MKKVILALSVIGLMTACGSSTEGEAPKTDSTAVAVDTTVTVVTDSVATDSVTVTTTTTTTK